jgi:AcrR family transcriptional regulator
MEMATVEPERAPDRRKSYHHGHLREALLEAGYAAARSGGGNAVVLRELARATGVSARAAYRHFDNHEALLAAVGRAALADMACTIERLQEKVAAIEEPAERALQRLQAVGEGYIAYALAQPGGFDTALYGLASLTEAVHPEAAGSRGRTAYQLLQDALDDLVATGLLDPSQRDDAAVSCWSSVHGFASLATRGPLRELPRTTAEDMAHTLVATTVARLAPLPRNGAGATSTGATRVDGTDPISEKDPATPSKRSNEGIIWSAAHVDSGGPGLSSG